MAKKAIVISTSLRRGSNSHALAEEFARGAREAGNDVELVSLAGKQIGFCRGCLACQKTGRCVIADDAVEIEQKVVAADVVCWATPIYYYELSGQMKTLIDRLNPMYPKDYRFRDVYLLMSAAETDPATPERAIAGLGGWIACYPECSLRGTVFCGGVDKPGDTACRPELAEAYEMGRAV